MMEESVLTPVAWTLAVFAIAVLLIPTIAAVIAAELDHDDAP